MGCDIHAYVEYRDRTPRNQYAERWRDFGGRINPGRNYSIFERMAGVRGDESNAVAPLRGFPDDAAYAAQDDNVLLGNGEYEETSGIRNAEHDGKPQWVAKPDWHSHSWLTCDEYATALAAARYATPNEEPEYHALLAAMRSLDASGYAVRLVFWFDN